MGMGLKSCVAVYLLELVRILLQYKWGTIFHREWFWRMEELTKRNGKGIWLREIEKSLKRFGASLEWFLERVEIRDEEVQTIRQSTEMVEREKKDALRAKMMKSIADVIEEVDVLVDTHFFNQFSQTKSSTFLKKVLENQGSIDLRLFRRTWRTMNCSQRP